MVTGIVIVMVGLGLVSMVVAVLIRGVQSHAAADAAARRGLDPNEAANVTLLTGRHGLAAAYGREPARTDHSVDRSIEERLAQLDGLAERGVISAQEHADRRAAILAEI